MGELAEADDSPPEMQVIELSKGWEFKQADVGGGEAWMAVKSVPSMVHQDLIDNKRLVDPFIGFNELKANWVGEKSWIYRTTFATPKSFRGSKIVLAFGGLDTFATVRLNEKTVLESDNMFLCHRVDITDYISSIEDNQLEITFASALLKARQIKDAHPDHKWVCFNGEPARLAVRKAQYAWGWDWGPKLMCAGIWRPTWLELYTARIAHMRVDVELADDHRSAKIQVTADVESLEDHDLQIGFSIYTEGTTQLERLSDVTENGIATTTFKLNNPKLWMPNGYGSQTLYTIYAALKADGQEIHMVSKRVGIRSVQLVQQPDSHGKSFFFRINGVDIFGGGSCWIPTDSILTNVTPERYRAWIGLMVPANQKMIRVWGGGIYEDDAFYDACDELGVLVWQDFMFGCGNYPCFPEILTSIEAEAITNVRRIRHHPSLVIFAGNNEDYQVAEQSHLTYDYADKNENKWLKTDFPARYIYESLLPRVVKAEAPSIPYHPGSPWGDGKPTSDPTVGDMHQWNVWHGTQEKYQIYDSLGGRFNSEFGMEAFPHIDTINYFIEHEAELYPQSHVIDFHNKADGHERRIATYMVENVRLETKLEAYIHLTQLIQCEALMYGYRGWRKQWGNDRHCGGALVWQFNDCWPVTSWSIVDYFLRRKPAYYAMARVLAPIAVGVRRQHYDWSVTHARQPNIQQWELWAVSSRLNPIVADIEVRFISVRTGKEIRSPIRQNNVVVTANGTTNVITGNIDNTTEEPHVLAARLFINDQIVARDTDWPQPLKYLPFPERNVKVDFRGSVIHITADRPVKCLVFEERQGCHLSDSAIDVVPNDEQVITVKGLEDGDKPLNWTYLGVGEQ